MKDKNLKPIHFLFILIIIFAVLYGGLSIAKVLSDPGRTLAPSKTNERIDKLSSSTES